MGDVVRDIDNCHPASAARMTEVDGQTKCSNHEKDSDDGLNVEVVRRMPLGGGRISPICTTWPAGPA